MGTRRGLSFHFCYKPTQYMPLGKVGCMWGIGWHTFLLCLTSVEHVYALHWAPKLSRSWYLIRAFWGNGKSAKMEWISAKMLPPCSQGRMPPEAKCSPYLMGVALLRPIKPIWLWSVGKITHTDTYAALVGSEPRIIVPKSTVQTFWVNLTSILTGEGD